MERPKRGRREPSPLSRAEKMWSLGASIIGGLLVAVWTQDLRWGLLGIIVVLLIVNGIIVTRKGWR